MSSSDDCSVDGYNFCGQILNKYNIIYEIGTGSYSTVWMAYNIEDNKYYAIKIQTYNKNSKNELNILKKINKNELFTTLHHYFLYEELICLVFDLYACNIDSIIRKGKHIFNRDTYNKIYKQLYKAIYYMHHTLKIYHADLKTDNILIYGLNKYNEIIIEQYNTYNDKYNELKTDSKKKNKKIRKKLHKNICLNINLPDNNLKYIVDDKYLDNIKISISDFGNWCYEYEYYNTQFGTRYYRAPENLLHIKSNYSNDIWAFGCILYEILTGKILFNTDNKPNNISTNVYHLFLIKKICNDIQLPKKIQQLVDGINVNIELMIDDIIKNFFTYDISERIKYFNGLIYCL